MKCKVRKFFAKYVIKNLFCARFTLKMAYVDYEYVADMVKKIVELCVGSDIGAGSLPYGVGDKDGSANKAEFFI